MERRQARSARTTSRQSEAGPARRKTPTWRAPRPGRGLALRHPWSRAYHRHRLAECRRPAPRWPSCRAHSLVLAHSLPQTRRRGAARGSPLACRSARAVPAPLAPPSRGRGIRGACRRFCHSPPAMQWCRRLRPQAVSSRWDWRRSGSASSRRASSPRQPSPAGRTGTRCRQRRRARHRRAGHHAPRCPAHGRIDRASGGASWRSALPASLGGRSQRRIGLFQGACGLGRHRGFLGLRLRRRLVAEWAADRLGDAEGRDA